MATATLKRNKRIFPTELSRERIFVDIPQKDFVFFQLFADKMGWSVNPKVETQKMSTEAFSRLTLLEQAKYLDNSIDKNAATMTMEEIVQEVRDYRNGK